MKTLQSFSSRMYASWRMGICAALTGIALAGWGATAGQSPAGGRTGAELYAMRCGQCHIERYPVERTDAQWRTVILHMQVRSPLPPGDAKKILTYLQESN